MSDKLQFVAVEVEGASIPFRRIADQTATN